MQQFIGGTNMLKIELARLLKQGSSEEKLERLLEALETPAVGTKNPEISNPNIDNETIFNKKEHSESEEVKEIIIESFSDVKLKFTSILVGLLPEIVLDKMVRKAVSKAESENEEELKVLFDMNRKEKVSFIRELMAKLVSDKKQVKLLQKIEEDAEKVLVGKVDAALQESVTLAGIVGGSALVSGIVAAFTALIESWAAIPLGAAILALPTTIALSGKNSKFRRIIKEESEESEILLEGQSKEFYENRLKNAKSKLMELKAKLGNVNTPEKQANINAQIQKQQNLIGEYQSKRKNAAAKDIVPDTQEQPQQTNETAETKFTVRFVNQGGKEEELEIVAPSEEEARKKTLDMVDIKPDGIISVEKREDLEPAIIPTKEPENYDKNIEKKEGDVNMENKKDILKSVTESLDSIFDILRQGLNEEEFTDKGDEAAEPVATEDREAKDLTPDQDNKDLFPADEHKEVEEVKEVVVENVTSKGEEAAKPVATKKTDGTTITPAMDNNTIFPSDEHKESEEVKEIVIEGEQLDKAKEEVEKAGDADELNDAGSDTTDEKGELITQPESVDADKVRDAIHEAQISGEIKGTEIKAKIDNKDIFPADEHSESEEVKEIIIESNVYLENSTIKIEIPFESGETFIQDLSEKEQEVVQEALRSIYAAYTGAALNEDIDIPDDTEAEIKLYETKVTIDIPVRNYKEDLTEEDFEYIQEALSVLDALLKEECTTKGEVAAQPVATKETDGTTMPQAIDNKDVFPSDEHKEVEEVKEVVVENVTSKGEEAAKPVATKETKGEIMTPAMDNNTIFPSDEHKESEEVKEIIVENITSKGAVASKPVATKETKGEIMTPAMDNSTIFPANEHKESEEVKEIIVENITSKGAVASKPVATKETDGTTMTPSKTNSDVFPADEHKEVEEVKEIIIESEKEELNDAGSDTINDDGQIKDEAKPEKEESKAEPTDVTTDKEKVEMETAQPEPEKVEAAKPATVHEAVNYKSVKEAFLLESDYFEKDSYALVSAADKQAKLEKQMALLVARDSQDPLYEELVRTTALAKKLQEQLQERYNLFGKEKASELKSLKHEIDADKEKLPKFKYEKTDNIESSVKTDELFDVDKQKEDVKEVIVESILTETEIISELSEFAKLNEDFFSYLDSADDDKIIKLIESLDEEELTILVGILESADLLILEGKDGDTIKRAAKKVGKVAGKVGKAGLKIGLGVATVLAGTNKDLGATNFVKDTTSNYNISQIEKAGEKSEKESNIKYNSEKDQYKINIDKKEQEFKKTGDSDEAAGAKARQVVSAPRTEEKAKEDAAKAKEEAKENRSQKADVKISKGINKATEAGEKISTAVHDATGMDRSQSSLAGGAGIGYAAKKAIDAIKKKKAAKQARKIARSKK
jgi:hypothetical protein